MKKKSLKENINCHIHEHGSGSAVHGLGFIGALVYYATTAPTFWAGVIGFFKALVWPAFLVYNMMKYLGM